MSDQGDEKDMASADQQAWVELAQAVRAQLAKYALLGV